MTQLKWLDGYTGQTVAELIALEGKYRIDSLVVAFEEAVDRKWARGEKLSVEEFIILAVEAMEREVNNGGWSQFFINTPHFSPIIVDVLQRIHCPKTARIALMAIDIVEKAPITQEEIESGAWKENENREDLLNECDKLYFERPENIEVSLFEFIKANQASIQL
jgi:hypothetical protein